MVKKEYKVHAVVIDGERWHLEGFAPKISTCISLEERADTLRLPVSKVGLEERRKKDREYYWKNKKFMEYLETWSKRTGRSVMALREYYKKIEFQFNRAKISDQNSIRFFFERALRGYTRNNRTGGKKK